MWHLVRGKLLCALKSLNLVNSDNILLFISNLKFLQLLPFEANVTDADAVYVPVHLMVYGTGRQTLLSLYER